jgi:hypothetical protein
MAHTIREHDPEAALHAKTNEDHDRGQLDAVHLNSYFKPLKPAHLHATTATTSHTRLLRRRILAVMAIVAIVCAGGLLMARLRQ